MKFIKTKTGKNDRNCANFYVIRRNGMEIEQPDETNDEWDEDPTRLERLVKNMRQLDRGENPDANGSENPLWEYLHDLCPDYLYGDWEYSTSQSWEMHWYDADGNEHSIEIIDS